MDVVWHYSFATLMVAALVAICPVLTFLAVAASVALVTMVVDDGESPWTLLAIPVLVAFVAFTIGVAAWGWPAFTSWEQRYRCSEKHLQWDRDDVVPHGDCLPEAY